MRKYILLFLSVVTISVCAQVPEVIHPDGGGKIEFAQDEISPIQRHQIISMLKANTADLERKNILKQSNARMTHVNFAWPLRQAAGISDHGYYGISNYVDQNLSSPNDLLDYNCGSRTYDQANGYNHKGTDIFTWPFPWHKMATHAVEIIAAAPGTIIGKTDGNPDQSCALCSSCTWNAVYVQHADGSVAWYGHMKTNTTTFKAVGATVAQGELLGIVGSSGNSTGPHLHFEVYTNNSYTQLVDPFAGPCNSLNGTTSWWASQENYRVPTISKVMTHSIAPRSGTCPSEEAMNAEFNFSPGQIIYLGAYYRDNINGESAIHRLIAPDNSVYATWTRTFATTYNASWWWYTRTLPVTGSVDGVWKYEVTYNAHTTSSYFGINAILPLTLISFHAVKEKDEVHLKWETDNEINLSGFEIQRSQDASHFETIGIIQPKNNNSRQVYQSADKKPPKGIIYYRLKIPDQNGSIKYSEIIKIDNRNGKLWVEVSPVPFQNKIYISIKGESKNALLQLHSITGQLLLERKNLKNETISIETE